MCGAPSSRWAIAGLFTILCFSTARLGEQIRVLAGEHVFTNHYCSHVVAGSTVPSSSFTIKGGAVLGTFDVTGAQRDIHLTTGLTYSITCKAGGTPGLVDQRWYRDGVAVDKRGESAVCSSSLTEVFYNDEVDNRNHWVLKFCNFDTTLAGSYTCRPSSDYNKSLIISEGMAPSHCCCIARVDILLLQVIQALLLRKTSLFHLAITQLVPQWVSSCLAYLLLHLLT